MRSSTPSSAEVHSRIRCKKLSNPPVRGSRSWRNPLLTNLRVGAWAHAERPAQHQPPSVEIKPSRFDGKRLPIINLHWPSRLARRRSNIEPLPFKPGPSPSKLRRPLSNGLAPLFNIRGRSVKSGERPSKCRRPPANIPPRLSIGPARPAKLRPAPANYLGRLTDGRASLPECRLWSSVDRRPLLDYRRSSFVGGASMKNSRPSSFVWQRWLFECRRSMFKVRSR